MNTRHLVHRARRLFVCLALAMVPVLALSGCSLFGPKPEEVVKETLSADLDSLKTASEDQVKELFGDDVVSEMQTYGIDPKDFYDSLVKHFSYDNLQVKVDGDKATATLATTNVDVQKVATQWENDVLDYMYSSQASDDYDKLGEDGMMKKVMQSLVDSLAADDAPLKTADVSIDLEKGSDGSWTTTDDAQVAKAIFAGDDLQNDLNM